MTMTERSAEKPLRSPCVSICVLDEQDVCTGCQRTGQEISQWGKLNNEQRREVLAKSGQRAREQGLIR